MKNIFYCTEKQGFKFPDSKLDSIPETYIEVSQEFYDLFFLAQSDSGFVIEKQHDSLPVIRKKTVEELDLELKVNKSAIEREWRDAELSQADKDINTLEDEAQDATHLRAYRVALRNYPQKEGFPECDRPTIINMGLS